LRKKATLHPTGWTSITYHARAEKQIPAAVFETEQGVKQFVKDEISVQRHGSLEIFRDLPDLPDGDGGKGPLILFKRLCSLYWQEMPY